MSSLTPQDNDWSIDQLIQTYQSLLVTDENETNLTLEKQKLDIIQSTERQLKKLLQHRINVNMQDNKSDAEEDTSMLQLILRKIAYYFLILFGLFQDIAGSFIF